MRHSYRSELEGIDPLTAFIIPVVFLLLGIMAFRALTIAISV